ncbi:hypothetical protein NDU88_007511 [Pleurodeles waltl]|uniref:Uncharacterized protein n=1 Tax=Pleurodeles waltl TaxID=8319 RepID=A0AAV7VUN8_PLEWA|nr:hypothetical protein NDU88_007511 [Pleurodeles waltl]
MLPLICAACGNHFTLTTLVLLAGLPLVYGVAVPGQDFQKRHGSWRPLRSLVAIDCRHRGNAAGSIEQ